MHIKTIFWICRVEAIKLVTEVNMSIISKTLNMPTLHFEPEIWFSSEFDALTWIQENKGSWTIVKVFEST